MSEKETLHCEQGHDWTRPKVRGRKPSWCSEHKPVVEPAPASADGTVASPAERLDGARKVKKEKQQKVFSGLIDTATKAQENMDGERSRQVIYIVRELTERKRHPSDAQLLTERLGQLMREHRLTSEGRK